MTTGLVLIAAILVLGGVIATVGDRIGMRVGKARLSLFNLRPRQTATLFTILTGVIISATTFAILFAVDDQLRTGVFELREIQNDLRESRTELQDASREKRQIERELNQAVAEQNAAQRRLQRINRSLQTAIARQEQTEAELGQTQQQLSQTQSQLGQIQANFQRAQNLLQMVSQQATRLRSEIQQLQDDRQELIRQRDQVREQIAQRDQEIAERDRAIAEREAQLQELEQQQTFLAQEVQTLEREFQGLRLGNVALLRNQTLASGVVRIVTPDGASQAVDRLLQEANRVALQRIRPGTDGTDEQVIQITNNQVEQLTEQIKDGQNYVIRILSAGNYVVGEPCVLAADRPCIQVYAAAAPNELVFRQGEVIASASANPSIMDEEDLFERLNLLLAASQFRARQAGILADTIQIADGSTEAVAGFFEQLMQNEQPLEIQAVASEDTFTAGPVKLELVAVRDGQLLFGTQ